MGEPPEPPTQARKRRGRGQARQLPVWLLPRRFLIFGNAQLCLYAGQNVNAPKIDGVCHNIFFFLLYVHKDLKK